MDGVIQRLVYCKAVDLRVSTLLHFSLNMTFDLFSLLKLDIQ